MILRSDTRNKRPRSPALAEVSVAPLPLSSRNPHTHPPSPDSPLSEECSTTPASPRKSKKLKLQASYATHSPFPDYPHPTSGEALDVYNLLTAAHRPNGLVARPSPQTSGNSAETGGHVPNVIEAVIETILSQNTSATNYTRAKQSLDDAFGRNNFEKIVNAPKQKLIDAIRTGGLANKKAGMIQSLLTAVKNKHGVYSLQHLAGEPRTKGGEPVVMKDEEIMQELLSYNGVGPKTASCVLLFCLGRDSFAVDTHVYRLSRLLGWVPASADRVLAQAHLDIRVPGELKYGLHVLMIQHGRTCKGCKKQGSKEGCILKTYLRDRRIKTEDLNQGLVRADQGSEVKIAKQD